MIGLYNAFTPPTPYYHITTDLFTAVPFTKYMMPGYQEKITRHVKQQKSQFKEKEKT